MIGQSANAIGLPRRPSTAVSRRLGNLAKRYSQEEELAVSEAKNMLVLGEGDPWIKNIADGPYFMRI